MFSQEGLPFHGKSFKLNDGTSPLFGEERLRQSTENTRVSGRKRKVSTRGLRVCGSWVF